MAEVSAVTLHLYCQVEPEAHQPFLEPVFEKNQKCGTSQTPAIAGNMWHGWSLLRDEVENSETIAGLLGSGWKTSVVGLHPFKEAEVNVKSNTPCKGPWSQSYRKGG